MFYDLVKRTVDIVGSIFLLILFSPVIVVTAFAIKLTSPGPILADIPEKVGQGGKLFKIYKFRSMIINAHEAMRTDPRFRELYKKYKERNFKGPANDPRITTVGKLIRKHSIDEIPQLLNVIKSEMSIVGPRPCYIEEIEDYKRRYPNSKDYLKDILSVKPGITGFWQVSGRSVVMDERRLEMDAYYTRKRSLLLDILILLKTPLAMISGKGTV